MNFYEILGVAQTASEDEIKSAFRRLAVAKHPDKGGSAEEFIQLKTAYDTLKNPLLRKDYDLKLHPESIDNTYNTSHDFQTADTQTAPPPEAKNFEPTPIDEADIIRQLSDIAREIRLKSVLNTFAGLFVGLVGVVLTILTIGLIIFSGLINSGFGMMSRNFWQIVNPYTNLFGVLARSNIRPTAKISGFIKTHRRRSITAFAIIISIIISAIILSRIFL
ncbi:MAG: J domain-containing protein [Candidatus Nomurabacteria bacterium]|jgi:hypothetical protein|nr:J domain-containing protein [Candidatus Nomurabacteria bacterium]